jgi:hypothetical protein
MRGLLLFAVMMVAAKFGWQEWTYRSALADTLISTFRQAAVQRCQSEATSRNVKLAATVWNKPESMTLIVGSGTAAERFWQASDDLFRTAPANPILVILARSKPLPILCEYDVVTKVAAIYRK